MVFHNALSAPRSLGPLVALAFFMGGFALGLGAMVHDYTAPASLGPSLTHARGPGPATCRALGC